VGVGFESTITPRHDDEIKYFLARLKDRAIGNSLQPYDTSLLQTNEIVLPPRVAGRGGLASP
jgi:hypothetical protein